MDNTGLVYPPVFIVLEKKQKEKMMVMIMVMGPWKVHTTGVST